jgi:hypothetical protein
MTETKQFHIGDVLSITTGALVSHDHMGGIYSILDWMTGETLFTHQLPRALEAAQPVLKEAFPTLAEIEFPKYLEGGEKDAIFTWVDTQGELYGELWEVPKLAEGVYVPMDPISEYPVAVMNARKRA